MNRPSLPPSALGVPADRHVFPAKRTVTRRWLDSNRLRPALALLALAWGTAPDLAGADQARRETASSPIGPPVIIVLSGTVRTGGVFPTLPGTSIPVEGSPSSPDWDETISYLEGFITASGSTGTGTLTSTVNAQLDFTPNCFGCDDAMIFDATVLVYVRGCHQPFTYSGTATGELQVSAPNGCTSTGPHVSAAYNSQSITTDPNCGARTATINQSYGASGISSSTTRTFDEYPGAVYSAAASLNIHAEVAQSDGFHFSPRRVLARLVATLNLSASLDGSTVPPVVSITPPACVLCSRAALLDGNAYDPDDGMTPGAGIASETWTIPNATVTVSGDDVSVVWNAPGSYGATLEATDEECETSRQSKSITVDKPTAILAYNTSLTTDLLNGAPGRALVSRAMDEMLDKGWVVRIMPIDDLSYVETPNGCGDPGAIHPDSKVLCDALGEPCTRGLWVLLHGGCARQGATTVGSVQIANSSGACLTTLPAFAPCLGGKSLEWVRFHSCQLKADHWSWTGATSIDGDYSRTSPENGCPADIDSGEENLVTYFHGEDIPVACPLAPPPPMKMGRPSIAAADLDSLEGVLMTGCPDTTCLLSAFVPLRSLAQAFLAGTHTVQVDSADVATCVASFSVSPPDTGYAFLSIYDHVSDVLAPPGGNAIGPVVGLAGFRYRDAVMTGILYMRRTAYDSVVTAGKSVVVVRSPRDSVDVVTVPSTVSVEPGRVAFSFGSVPAGLVGLATSGPPVDVPGREADVASARVSATPNPFRGLCRLQWTLQQKTNVRVRIYDLNGRLVRKLCDREFDAGSASIGWDGKNERSLSCGGGIYLYEIHAAGFQASGKVVFVP